MDNQLFRDAMGKFTTGITVVTTKCGDEILGMTVNAFMSVSLEPKLIAISVGENASMYEKLQQTKKFGVSFLTEDQKELSKFFAKQMEEEQEVNYLMQDEIPVLKDSLVTLSCHTRETVVAGDHMIFIAEVTEIAVSDGAPILYADGQYRSIKSIDKE